ncbi:MAG: hypothetical protein IJX85_01425 [Lachnospiraceae bacterium]|nr:hypothetical protein [Lachnospiraceae bacterium]
MRLEDLEKLIDLSEYDSSEVKIELAPDIEEKVQELTDIIKSVPMEIWEQMGYDGYTEVDVERGERLTYYKNIENITIVLKGDHIIKRISGVGIRSIFWELAKYSKRYNEFCLKMCEWDISWLKAQKAFITEDEIVTKLEDKVAYIIDEYDSNNLYDVYFKKLGLKKPFISFCKKHNITDEVTIAEFKYRFVLEAFVRMISDEVNYFKDNEDYQYLTRYWNDSFKIQKKMYFFWDKFLSGEKDFRELYGYLEAALKTVKEIATKNDYMVFQELNAMNAVKHNVLYEEKKGPAYSLDYRYYGICEGYVCILEHIALEFLLKGESHNAKELIESMSHSQRMYDFLCDNIEKYQELKKKEFEDFDITVIKHGDGIIYTAEFNILIEQNEENSEGSAFRGLGRTEEEAVTSLRKKFDKNKEILIVGIINKGFSQFIETWKNEKTDSH